MSTVLPILAVVFDLGEVLVQLRSKAIFHALEIFADEDITRLSAVIRDHEAHDAFERGLLDAPSFFEEVRRATGIAATNEDWQDAWNAMIGPLVPGVVALIDKIKVPVYLLSNTNVTHFQHHANQAPELHGKFARTFTSFDLGFRKPQLEIFAAVEAAIHVKGPQILFFDDQPANIAGASAAGWQAVLVRQSAALMGLHLAKYRLISE